MGYNHIPARQDHIGDMYHRIGCAGILILLALMVLVFDEGIAPTAILLNLCFALNFSLSLEWYFFLTEHKKFT